MPECWHDQSELLIAIDVRECFFSMLPVSANRCVTPCYPQLDAANRCVMPCYPQLDMTNRCVMPCYPQLDTANRSVMPCYPQLDTANRCVMPCYPQLDMTNRCAMPCYPLVLCKVDGNSNKVNSDRTHGMPLITNYTCIIGEI